MAKFYDVAPLEGFPLETGLLLASLVDSTREWRENLGRVTADAVVWQPEPESHSIGALILHLADCEAYWLETFVAGCRRDPAEARLLMSDDVHQYGGRWPSPPRHPLEWYLDIHDRVRNRALHAVREVAPDQVFERKAFRCTFRWVLAHLVEHDAYHGGQAVLLNELWKKRRKSSRAVCRKV